MNETEKKKPGRPKVERKCENCEWFTDVDQHFGYACLYFPPDSMGHYGKIIPDTNRGCGVGFKVKALNPSDHDGSGVGTLPGDPV